MPPSYLFVSKVRSGPPDAVQIFIYREQWPAALEPYRPLKRKQKKLRSAYGPAGSEDGAHQLSGGRGDAGTSIPRLAPSDKPFPYEYGRW